MTQHDYEDTHPSDTDEWFAETGDCVDLDGLLALLLDCIEED